MTTVNVCKASASGNCPVDSVTLVIDGDVPNFDYKAPLEECAQFYDEQAQLIFDALTNSLPGGTLDRLLGKMLAHKASHFRVLSWKDEGA